MVRPNDLTPVQAHQVDDRRGAWNASGVTARFWKTLRLPVGARITGLSHRRIASTAAPTVVGLDGVNPGATPAWGRIFEAASTEISPTGSAGTVVSGVPGAASRRVRRGWTYFLLVQTESSTAGVGDITVRYRTR